MYIRVSVDGRVAGGTKGDLGKEGEEEKKSGCGQSWVYTYLKCPYEIHLHNGYITIKRESLSLFGGFVSSFGFVSIPYQIQSGEEKRLKGLQVPNMCPQG